MPIFSARAKWTIWEKRLTGALAERENFLEKIWRAGFLAPVPFWETVGIGGYPPSPRISGIIELAENRKIIYGLQQLAGKILSPVGLRLKICPSNSRNFHATRFRCGDDPLIRFCAQGQMSHRAVDFYK
jgi:hypothetical protein